MTRTWTILGSIALGAGLAMAAATLAADAPGEKPAVSDSGRVHRYFFSLIGQRPTFVEDGVTNVEVIVPNEKTEGRYSIITSQWNADFQVQPHYHKYHSETFYVLDGEVEWTVGGETHVLKKGEAVYVPPNTIHSIRVVGGKPMQNMLIYEPGGYEEQADFRMNYTEEELKRPEVRDRIRKLGDFNLP